MLLIPSAERLANLLQREAFAEYDDRPPRPKGDGPVAAELPSLIEAKDYTIAASSNFLLGGLRELTSSQQDVAYSDAFLIVRVEERNGRSTFSRQSQYPRFDKLEVIIPILISRMIERDNLIGSWIDRRDVGSLLQVAAYARKTQVLQIAGASMLATYDVVDLMRHDRCAFW